ncbi:MAG: hypothetical protein ACRDLP_16220, partial [Solirubrobacteraceae bacterium]
DEAHMLSTAAWNAFLKTLEEPPPNTVFVLATTDAQKVLPTVVDRCHRFDFQRPTVEQIATVLERVAAAESISIGPEAVAVLARHAAGSFRDALGTLEQLQTYAGAEISLGDVLAVLGISDVELLVRAMDAVAAGDPRGALGVVGDGVEGGHDPAAFIRELESHARELLIVALQDGVVPPELRLTPERDERLAEQAAALSTAALVRTLDLLATALTHLKAGADARTQLELALIRAARPDLDPSVQALATRVDALEGGSGAPRSRPQVDAAVEVVVDEPPPAVAVEEVPVAVVVEEPPVVVEEPAPDMVEEPPPAPSPIVNGGGQTDAEGEGSLTIEVLRRQWPAVLDTVKASNPMLGAVVDEARPVELDGDRLVLAFAEDAAFQCRKAEERANRVALSEAMRTVTGCTLTLTYELRAGDAPATPASLTEDELVARLLDEFGAELMADADEEEGS